MTAGSENTDRAVEAVADEEFQAMERGDTAGFLRLLAPDAVFFPPNESPISGPAVGPWIGEFLSRYTVRFEQHRHEDVLLADRWAVLCTGFRWRVVPQDGGDAIVRLGNTVRLFRQNDTGAWQLAREIWNTYPAT